MTCEASNVYGGDGYFINATGDVVVGDEVKFERAIFDGSWRRPKFTGFETVVGRVVRDSYGSLKQQHTFTIQLEDGSTTRIKGRNLYGNGVYRRKWADELARRNVANEKHIRGNKARADRDNRRACAPLYSGHCADA